MINNIQNISTNIVVKMVDKKMKERPSRTYKSSPTTMRQRSLKTNITKTLKKLETKQVEKKRIEGLLEIADEPERVAILKELLQEVSVDIRSLKTVIKEHKEEVDKMTRKDRIKAELKALVEGSSDRW